MSITLSEKLCRPVSVRLAASCMVAPNVQDRRRPPRKQQLSLQRLPLGTAQVSM